MRHKNISRIVLLLLCCPGLQIKAGAQARISLKQAIEKHLVMIKDARATGKGSSNRGIELRLVNTTCDSIAIEIDPGMVFHSQAKDAPEMVLGGYESLWLAPEKMMNMAVTTYYTALNVKEPAPGAKYALHKQDRTLGKLLAYLHEQHIARPQAQNAILTVTAGTALATVYDAKRPKASKDLEKFLSTSIRASSSHEVTRSFAAYKPPPPRDTKTVVTLNLDFPAQHNLNVHIVGPDGFAYGNMHQKEYNDGHTHTVDVELDTAQMRHGTIM
jgi:hypothetical protein